MKYLLCFGNPHIKEDNKVINIVDDLNLKDYTIVKCTSPEEIMFYSDKEFIILDVAKGIDKITIIENADQLNANNIISLHDFDLNFFLKLYKSLGHKFKIIAVPQDYDTKKLKQEIEEILS